MTAFPCPHGRPTSWRGMTMGYIPPARMVAHNISIVVRTFITSEEWHCQSGSKIAWPNCLSSQVMSLQNWQSLPVIVAKMTDKIATTCLARTDMHLQLCKYMSVRARQWLAFLSVIFARMAGNDWQFWQSRRRIVLQELAKMSVPDTRIMSRLSTFVCCDACFYKIDCQFFMICWSYHTKWTDKTVRPAWPNYNENCQFCQLPMQ